MDNIIVIGSGGHAKVVVSIIRKTGKYNILGYTDIEDQGEVLGCPFIGNDNVLEQLIKDHPGASIVIGLGMLNSESAIKRKKIFDYVCSLGYNLPTIVSPDAIVNTQVSIGSGTVVMDGVVINSGTEIGKGVILNTRCSVDHDCTIGDFVHIAPGATLSGGVEMGENCFVGTGAVISEYKRIESNSTLGAGTVVVNDLTVPGIYVGIPSRKIK